MARSSAARRAPHRHQGPRVSVRARVAHLALLSRIWRRAPQFSGPRQCDGKGSIEAPRVSPTNIGLLLNTRQVASELGFLTTPEFAALTGSTLRTIDRMEKFRGHLYNWYDTETLRPLDKSPFVSSVDSGNLVASFFTLHAGTRALANKPLIHADIFAGLRAHLWVLGETNNLPGRFRELRCRRTPRVLRDGSHGSWRAACAGGERRIRTRTGGRRLVD